MSTIFTKIAKGEIPSWKVAENEELALLINALGLEEDMENLNLLLLMLADITPEHDSKLQQLVADLRHKFANPINEGNKKAIIFTAFSDTALYLYDCLAQKIKDNYGLNVALITGDVEARSTLKLKEKLDFNKVLTLFSPISNLLYGVSLRLSITFFGFFRYRIISNYTGGFYDESRTYGS